MKDRKVIWTGELEWEEILDDKNVCYTIESKISAAMVNGVPEVQPENWPKKLRMQNIIPEAAFVQTTGCHYTKSVHFHPNESVGLARLTKRIFNGFFGRIYFISLIT